MIVGIGIDAVDVARMRTVLARTPSFAARVFSAAELEYAHRRRDPTEPLAARFAAKEAVLKAMGLGLGHCAMTDIEVGRDDEGVPAVVLHGPAIVLAADRAITTWHLSLTHTETVAMAVALAER